MTILEIFINFINQILSFKILGFQLITHLLTFSVIIVIFKILNILGNNGISRRKNNNDYEPKHAKK